MGEVKVVRDMHERKAEMAKHADAFIALPGPSLGQRPALISGIIIISNVRTASNIIHVASVY